MPYFRWYGYTATLYLVNASNRFACMNCVDWFDR
jgi:hypothetical protein